MPVSRSAAPPGLRVASFERIDADERAFGNTRHHICATKHLGSLLTALMVLACSSSVFATGASARRGADLRRDISPAQQERLVRSIGQHVLAFTNAERKRAGRAPLESSEALKFLARKHTEHMCLKDALDHESVKFPKGWQRFGERLAIVRLESGAENIAYKTMNLDGKRWAEAIVAGWMKSPHHRINILNPQWRYLGVGVVPCARNIGFATQVFSDEPGRMPARPTGMRIPQKD